MITFLLLKDCIPTYSKSWKILICCTLLSKVVLVERFFTSVFLYVGGGSHLIIAYRYNTWSGQQLKIQYVIVVYHSFDCYAAIHFELQLEKSFSIRITTRKLFFTFRPFLLCFEFNLHLLLKSLLVDSSQVLHVRPYYHLV